jgi:hypothetical protein
VWIFDAASGRKVAQWNLTKVPQRLKLSHSGDRLLEIPGDPNTADDILIRDVKTGQVLRTYASGYRQGQSFGAGNADFIGSTSIVTTPAFPTDIRGHYAGKSVNVINLASGTVERQFTPVEFGPTGQLQVSDSIIETESAYLTAGQIRSDRFVPAKASYFLFDATKPDLACRVRLPEVPAHAGEGYFRIEFSPDLKYAVMVYNDPISVFRVLNCPVINTNPGASNSESSK